MSGRGKSKRFLSNVCGIAYVPHTLCIRSAYVPHTLPHTLPHTSSRVEALQAVYFSWVAMSISP